MRRILFLLSSGRRNGNSEGLARRAQPKEAVCDWIDLTQASLPPFQDGRTATAAPLPSTLADIASRMRAADDVVFVAPVYWYGLPAPAKLLLDHWSGFLERPDLDFRAWIAGKRLWLITTRADPDPTVHIPLEQVLRRSGEWLGMAWGGALHAVADAPGDVELDPAWHLAAGFLTLRN